MNGHPTKHGVPVFICSLLLVLFLSACANSISDFVAKAKKHPETIPADFNPQKHVLLFAEMPRLNKPGETNPSVTKKLNEALQEYCPYKYEIVSKADLDNKAGKYSDTTKYKFVVLSTLYTTTHSHTSTNTVKDPYAGTYSYSVSPSARTTKIDFMFHDRASGKTYYPSGNASTNLKYTLAAIMETIRQVKAKK